MVQSLATVGMILGLGLLAARALLALDRGCTRTLDRAHRETQDGSR